MWSGLDVEAELHHVTIDHDVVLTFHTDLALGLRLSRRTSLIKIVERDNLRLDETFFKERGLVP